ncbi:hypothetical protein BGZ60DRAFT_535605 [Tricladium varicosporioides]|nr:hypothetical protein BGZ60DRAFT_535605 [Hymenoscyphus varicosporioides]
MAADPLSASMSLIILAVVIYRVSDQTKEYNKHKKRISDLSDLLRDLSSDRRRLSQRRPDAWLKGVDRELEGASQALGKAKKLVHWREGQRSRHPETRGRNVIAFVSRYEKVLANERNLIIYLHNLRRIRSEFDQMIEDMEQWEEFKRQKREIFLKAIAAQYRT